MTTDGFQGTDRHLIRRSIGSGSFGMVFEAFDHDRQAVVALKMLTHMGPEALLQFKREFRTLADLSHPNLVGLFELFAEENRAYFTMELVDGTPFSAWVREEAKAPKGSKASRHRTLAEGMPGRLLNIQSSQDQSMLQAEDMATWLSDSDRTLNVPITGPGRPVRDPERLRTTATQLVDGVIALHGAGKLHRDLKSNNVLITPEGRVVILDFGLVLDLAPQDMWALGLPPKLVGTPSHMAPEQGATGVATEASDWYSVGVMLYESLSGRLPFQGTPMEIIQAKNEMDPPALRELAPGVPDDLADLAMGLLRRNPAARPQASEIRVRLGQGLLPEISTQPAARRALVGREAEMAGLLGAFEEVEAGEARTVLLHGSSGLGKTFLVRRFLRTLQQDHPRAVLLFGRCYEQESVPFKAVDGLIDALSQILRFLPTQEVEALLPRHIHALAKLFPVLQQVGAVAKAGGRVAEIRDPQELRRRAFGALRELLARLGESRPLVLVVDDLHWGDLDSAALLSELLRPPDPPRVLTVLCYRSEEEESAPTLAALLPELREQGLVLTEFNLARLSQASAEALARSLVDDPARAEEIVREAGGNPLFIGELARADAAHASSTTAGASDVGTVFDRALLARVAALPARSRDVLHLLAVAGYPVEWETLRRAARIDPSGADPFAPLRTARLARVRGVPGRRILEAYHDRVRESVAASLGAEEAKTCHLSLAAAIESSSRPDTQALAFHYGEAGLKDRAAHYAAKAGAEAEAALAFERAAAFYERSIVLREPADPEIPALRLAMAEALSHAGQSPKAAEAFLEAGRSAAGTASRELRRRAAEELFKSGHLEAALAISKDLLAWAGARIPKGNAAALLSLLWSRFRLKRRGFAFSHRAAGDLQEEVRERLDILWTVAHGLGPYDVFRATDLQARQFRLALDAGDPHRVMRGLAHETVLQAAEGVKARREVQRLLALTTSLAERIGSPDAMARAHIAAGLVALQQGRWAGCLDHMEKGESMLVTGASYEFHVAQYYGLRARSIMGGFHDVARRFHELIQVARHQGDRLMEANLQIVLGSLLRLREGEPGEALAELDEAIALLPADGFFIPHVDHLIQRGNVLLYQARAKDCQALLTARRRGLKRSFLLNVQGIRISVSDLEARCDLALLAGGDRAAAGRAKSAIKSLQGEGSDYATAFAMKNQGLLLWMEGRREEALAVLLEAVTALDALQMGLHAAAVRRVRGRLMGGPIGADLVAQAEGWMQDEGIADLDAMTGMVAPVQA
ncbi:MAG: AAA family ATPase [Holophagaceae bacterium]|nr:AAA family ATPase [Holophagaceae bacterium]